MAPHADRLADIEREGFDLVNRFYGGGTSGQAPKKQYKVPQQYAPDIGREGFHLVGRFYGGGTSGQAPKKQYNVPQQYAPVPSEMNVIDSAGAAQKFKGMAFTPYYKKFVGRRL